MGYASLRFELLTREHVGGLGRFVIDVGLPVLIFNTVASRPVYEAVQPKYLAAYAAASVCGFLFGWLYSRKIGAVPTLAALNGMGFGMSNSGLIGFPMLSMAVGTEKAGVFFVMNVLVEMLLIIPTMLILLDLAKNSEMRLTAALQKAFLNLFKNPIMLGLMAGLLVSLSGITLPSPLMKTAAMLAGATSPLALFVIGAGLYGLVMKGRRTQILQLGLLRTAMFPLLVIGFLVLLDVPHDVLMIGALLGSAGIPSSYALFGRQHGHGQETSALLLAVTLMTLLPVTLALVSM